MCTHCRTDDCTSIPRVIMCEHVSSTEVTQHAYALRVSYHAGMGEARGEGSGEGAELVARLPSRLA